MKIRLFAIQSLACGAFFVAGLWVSGSVTLLAAENSGIGSAEKIELLGVAEIAGNATDKSNLHEALDADTTNDLLGGFSAIAYSGKDNVYYFLPDRGPKDGEVNWTCRWERFTITINPTATPAVKLELLDTTILTDQAGRPFVGSASAFEADKEHGFRLDPEGIRLGENGNLWIADEYGPHLMEFSSNGKLIRELPMPSRFQVQHSALTPEEENPLNESGRATNRGIEGLAISENGQTLFGLLQSCLLQDSFRLEQTDYPLGLNCRLMQISTSGVEEKEMLYRLEHGDHKLNEILTVGPDSFLVIERDGEAGANAKCKKLMMVSAQSASDISKIEKLPPKEIPVGVMPLQTSVFIDLLDPQWKLAGETMPEKLEGLTFGPDLPDGRRTLLVGSDNDFITSNASVVYVFAVPQAMLEGGNRNAIQTVQK